MLVLTRRLDQSVMIGDDVKVTVVEIRGGQVRLGFDAPRGLSVHRQEIWLQLKAEFAQDVPGGEGSDSEDE